MFHARIKQTEHYTFLMKRKGHNLLMAASISQTTKEIILPAIQYKLTAYFSNFTVDHIFNLQKFSSQRIICYRLSNYCLQLKRVSKYIIINRHYFYSLSFHLQHILLLHIQHVLLPPLSPHIQTICYIKFTIQP